jgi:hypothetical protein
MQNHVTATAPIINVTVTPCFQENRLRYVTAGRWPVREIYS